MISSSGKILIFSIQIMIQPGFLENKRHLRCAIGHLLINCELSVILHHCGSIIFYHTYLDQAQSVTALH